MRRLKVAVVGVGAWGKNHARTLSSLPEAELVAVCDSNVERAERVGHEFGVEFYGDYKRLLLRRDVDAVSVCTWATGLASVALNVLRAGKHVLVEKPMAANIKDAKHIVALAERERLCLTVGLLTRFIPEVPYIKKLIVDGEFGNVVCATARRVSQWPERIGDVGVVKDIAVHDIDITRFLFGEDPVAVYAKVGKMHHVGFEDYAQVMLDFRNEKTAFIEANWITPYKARTLIVTGSKCVATLDYMTQEVRVDSDKLSCIPRFEVVEPLKLELQSFVEAVLNNRQPVVTGEDGIKALMVAEAALKSAAKNRVVKLNF